MCEWYQISVSVGDALRAQIVDQAVHYRPRRSSVSIGVDRLAMTLTPRRNVPSRSTSS